jgi:hypothetical protein
MDKFDSLKAAAKRYEDGGLAALDGFSHESS